MSSLLRGFSLLLIPLCGWLAGDAVQAKTTLHLAALQRTIEPVSYTHLTLPTTERV